MSGNAEAGRVTSRQAASNQSVAGLYREFGDGWEIEPIPPGTKWIAVQRETTGDYIRIVLAHEMGTLRFRMNEAEQEEPEEREQVSSRQSAENSS